MAFETPPNGNNTNEILKVAIMFVMAYFAAFAKGFNLKVENTKNTKWLVAHVVFNGFCGFVCGLIAMIITDDIKFISVISSIGGLLGMNFLIYIFKLLMAYVAAMKNVDLSKVKGLDDGLKDTNNSEQITQNKKITKTRKKKEVKKDE